MAESEKADSDMSDKPPVRSEIERTEFSREVGAKAARKLRAQRTPLRSVWLGFGVTGVIGWSVAVPALLGALLGLWLDGRYPGGRSWTLTLLMAGLCIGCIQAWHWVAREDRAMHEDTAAHDASEEQPAEEGSEGQEENNGQ
jgi:ATP synthase protein I